MKTCARCLNEYPSTTEYFYRYKATKDGLQSYCKKCSNTRVKQWAHAHPDKVRENNSRYYRLRAPRIDDVPDGMKRCPRCSALFPKTKEGYCRTCKREITKEWRQNNPDRYREIQKRSKKKNGRKRTALGALHAKERTQEWYKRTYRTKRATYLRNSQVRRARKHNLPYNFTERDWQRCLNYFNHRCAICGRPPGLWHRLAQDHWVAITDPRPDNPGTTPSNIIPLCHGVGGCNNSKRNSDPVEWLRKRFGIPKANVIAARIETYFASVRSSD